jgi:endo-1,4-beta-mannosidase
MTRYLRAFGKPTFLLGVNYWSRPGGPRMWEDERFDEVALGREIAEMRGLGLNACRAFLFLPSFMPEPPRVEPAKLDRLARFAERCTAAGLAVLPSLLVGHMSGENFDFPGQRGRSAYTDETVVGWERALAREAAARLRGSPAVSAWVLSNEMPLWGGPASVPTITAWCKVLADELRAASGGVPVGSGDGVMNMKGGQNGFDAAQLGGVLDYLGPHAYPADPDPLRQALYTEYAMRSLQHLGKPVVLEEFGCSSCQAGEAEQAAYWAENVYAAIGVGAAGALGWCFSDFALSHEAPYSHHAFELGFGVTHADGTPKPVGAMLQEAGRLVAALPWAEVEAQTPRAALVRPSYLETTYPFSWEERSRMVHGQLQAYAMARKAGLEVAVLPESSSFADCDLILVPSTQKLLAPTWERLLARAQHGATVYWSYFGGDYDFHQGMWCHRFEQLTGCRHRLRYGVPDLPPPRLTARGDGLRLDVHTDVGGPFARARLPIEPTSAAVVAKDSEGRPALCRQAIGRGQLFFSPYPWEFYLGEQPDVNGHDASHTLYGWLAARAGLSPDAASDPRVQLHRLRLPGAELLIAINRSWDTVTAEVDAEGGGGEWAPKEVRALRIPRR